MRRNKIYALKIFLVVLAIFSLVITTGAINTINQQKNSITEQKHIVNVYRQQSMFLADITFTLYEGTGCGCTPVANALITAWGLDVDHNTSGVTDENGKCILQLEINYNYRIIIEAEGFKTVMFDFLVLDDQNFVFHLGGNGGVVLKESSPLNNLLED
jgi:hypothetical protein